MINATRIRNATWPLRLLSVVTLVALIIAPSCAPLCAGKSCPQAEGSAVADGSCHKAGAMHHNALLSRSIRNCNSRELPAIVSTSSGFSGASGTPRLSVNDGNYLAVETQNAAVPVPFSDTHLGRSPDSLSSFVSVPTSVLRI